MRFHCDTDQAEWYLDQAEWDKCGQFYAGGVVLLQNVVGQLCNHMRE